MSQTTRLPLGSSSVFRRTGSGRSTFFRVYLVPSAVAILILIAYLPGLNAPFYMDDEFQILQRPELRPGTETVWRGTTEILARHGMDDRPLAFVSFYWNRLLAGDDPFAFRVVNLALHIGSFFLLFGLLRGATRGNGFSSGRESERFSFLPLGVAALWASNPANIQAVTYVVQRVTGAMTFFCLASVGSFLAGCRAVGGGKRVLFLVLAAVLMVLSLGFKQNAVLIPFFWYLAWRFLGKDEKSERGQKRVGSSGKWASALLLAWTVLLVWQWVRMAGSAPSPEGLSWTAHWMTAGRVVTYLTGLFFLPFPSRLHLNYDIQPSSGLLSPLSTLGGILFIAAWVVSIVLLRKRDRWISFGLAWALIGILPESLLPSLDLAFEHRLYLPSIGLTVAGCRILYLLTLLPFRGNGVERRRARLVFPGVLALVLVLWSVWTWERNGIWADPGRFIGHEWTMSPRHPRTIGGMMHYMLGQHRYREAIELGESALRRKYNPLDESVLRNNLALAYGGAGDWGSAVRLLENMVFKGGNAAFLFYNLGVSYYESGKRDLAMQCFREVLAGDPYHPEANYYVGKVLRDQGNPAEAIPLLERTLSMRPSDPEVLRDLLDACIAVEDWRRASDLLGRLDTNFQQADPLSIELLRYSGLVYLKTGHLDEAETAYRRYLKHVPRDTVVRYNLACVLSLQGEVRQSLALVDELLSMGFRDRVLFSDPDLASVRQDPGFRGLAARYGLSGRPSK